MQSNKLRMAIRATAAMTVMGLASQAQAFNLNAGDVDASLYGYVRMNASYDMDADIADSSQSGSFGNLASSNDEIDGHFGASAQQSRFGFTATHSEGVKVNVEGDFYGGDFRLRHAYGQYENWLIGQTWSNYNSFVGNTSVLDFTGQAGWAGYQLRSVQARYTSGPFSFSVEENKGSIYAWDAAESERSTLSSAKDSMPTFTVRVEDSAGAVSYSAAALMKQVSYDDGSDDDSAIGFAAFGALKFQLTDMVTIQGALNYGNGANSYVYLSGANDAYLDGDSLETITTYGGSIGTGISLGGGRSINLGYGMTKADWDDAEDDNIVGVGGAQETNQNVFLNYQWTPVKNTMMGVEYGYWDTENVDGDSKDANRIMFAAQYNF
ncbi:DcaP family trimeric outer membrane transporter [Marinobacter nauticus]|uniref:DcaP family trimeric outer membrane transporter n=1 Tax=Marinobacter nauticus TaxID=2743 RepID=UPI001CD1AA42|nr:DcaP family trimeric outer membrane transporter [Marinobacter nauticus]MCA0914233.1 hypothetical protein [Marinobacter nauticus]